MPSCKFRCWTFHKWVAGLTTKRRAFVLNLAYSGLTSIKTNQSISCNCLTYIVIGLILAFLPTSVAQASTILHWAYPSFYPRFSFQQPRDTTYRYASAAEASQAHTMIPVTVGLCMRHRHFDCKYGPKKQNVAVHNAIITHISRGFAENYYDNFRFMHEPYPDQMVFGHGALCGSIVSGVSIYCRQERTIYCVKVGLPSDGFCYDADPQNPLQLGLPSQLVIFWVARNQQFITQEQIL